MQPFEIVLAALVTMSPIFALIISIKVAKKNDDKDIRDNGQKQGVMQSDIGYIKSSTDRIEKLFDKLAEKQDQMSERLVKVEQGLSDHIKDKNAHNYGKGGSSK